MNTDIREQLCPCNRGTLVGDCHCVLASQLCFTEDLLCVDADVRPRFVDKVIDALPLGERQGFLEGLVEFATAHLDGQARRAVLAAATNHLSSMRLAEAV